MKVRSPAAAPRCAKFQALAWCAFANQLPEQIESLILRPGAENLATPRQPVRHEAVTYVLGTRCYLCLRAGQNFNGERGGTRTLDPMIKSHVLYRLSYALT